MSAGTLVIEAALKSGSLITARLAMEQGREVFSIPGSIRNPLSRGCHALIRDGAKLTESIADIFEEIGPLHRVVINDDEMSVARQAGNERLDEHAKLLLDNIGYDPVTIDLLVEETGISANLAAAALLSLELQNLIESLPGGSFIRKN
jgi:DNA processing protein